jgi:hypothetical protein
LSLAPIANYPPYDEEAIVTPAVRITSAEDCSFSFQMILAGSLTGGDVRRESPLFISIEFVNLLYKVKINTKPVNGINR